MPHVYTYTEQAFRPTIPDERDLAGEDIMLERGVIPLDPSGSWSTVTEDRAARQSVIREAGAPVGGLVRRQAWGMGLPGLLFRGLTKPTRDDAVARIRRRMAANPRVTKIVQISAAPLTDESGLGIDLRFTSGNRGIATSTVMTTTGRPTWR